MPPLYDRIGLDYAQLRRPDPRIAACIDRALGDAETVLNVGAGTGSYEPAGRTVTAVEPSAAMIRQRPAGTAPAVQARAEDLPFPDRAFDASMAVLTVHHWADQARGLREMRRVVQGPVVILTFDPAHRGSWLTDYLPQVRALDEAQMPPLATYAEALGPVEITPIPVPGDCTDGFLYAYWRRPAAYLDARVRSGSSSFWALQDVDQALTRLADDLKSGAWRERYGHLLGLEELDVGYRLVRTI